MRKLAVLPVLWGLVVPGAASAQSYEAPKPIDVPTAPVPQEAPPPPPKKADPPKPAPVAPKGDSGKAPEEPKDKGGDKDKKAPPTFDKDGVFKVSGSGANLAKPKDAAKGAPGKGGGKVVAKKVDTSIVAQWPGFRMTEDTGSEVMVEFSKAVGAPARFDAAGTVTFVFKGALVLKHNNQNPLITTHFNTPVSSARLVPKKGELHLVIDLRAGATAAGTSGLRPGAEAGSLQFFIKFPGGSYLPKDADDEPMLGPNPKLKGGKGESGKKDDDAAPKPPPKKPKKDAKPGPSE